LGVWKRPLCRIAAGFAVGILLGAKGCTWYLAAAVMILSVMSAGCCLAAYGSRQHAGCKEKTGDDKKGKALRKYGYACIVFVTVLGAVFLGQRHYLESQKFRAAYQTSLSDGMSLMVQGEVKQKEYKNGQYIYYLTSCKALFLDVSGVSKEDTGERKPVSCNQIMVYADTDTYGIGTILVLNGTVELWSCASNEGNFDAQQYYFSREIDFKLKSIQVLSVHGKTNALKEWLYGLRLRLRDVYAQCLIERDCGVVTTMVLGDKSLLDEDIKELYQKTGISHILAISGLHISVIGMTLYGALRGLGMGFGASGCVAGMVMLCFGTMTGMGTSVTRAVVMFLLLLFARAAGRSYDSLSALSAAALWLLWENPEILFYAGFLLSFAAVLGAVYLGGVLLSRQKEDAKKENGFWKKRKEKFWESFFVSLAIQLATIPLSAWYYYELPVYGILVNLVVLPLMAWVLYFGIAGGIVGLWWRKGAKMLLFPCHLILQWYEWVCVRASELPGAVYICGQPKGFKMAVYYLMLAGLTAVLWREKKKAEKGNKENKGKFLRARMAAGGGILLAFLLISVGSRFEIDVLDVGQGDGIYIQGNSGITLFVDGGSSSVSKVGQYRILPFLKAKGVKKIDYWAVSHTDSDHILGLLEILEEGYPVESLLLSKDMVWDDTLEELLALARAQGTKVLWVSEGDVLHLGDASVEIVSPAQGVEETDKNAASLVFYYKEGDFLGLFTGDIGIEQEQALLESGKVKNIDFYKAAHHGSKGSNGAGYLKELSPAVSVISCGLHNRYGHPAEEAVEHMENAGSAVFYTMEGGRIRLTIEKGELLVEKYLQPLDEYRCPVVE
jgi:competence protein ComEC